MLSEPAVYDVRFGHTRFVLVEGEPIFQLREALCAFVNARGVMASGFAGAIRLSAGPDVERDLRAQGPLTIGNAYLTPPGALASKGVRHIVHAIVALEPGQPPTRKLTEQSLTRSLELLDRTRTRSLTLPEVGIRVPGIRISEAAALLVTILAAHLRRGALLDEVVIAGLHSEYLRACRDRFLEAGARQS